MAESIQDLLRMAVERQASDLHIKAMRPPLLRIEKKLVTAGEEVLEPATIEKMLGSILNPKQRARLDEQMWVDMGYSLPGVSRFRVSVAWQRGTLAAVFRRIPFQFPSIDDWGLPEVLKEFSTLPGGMVLITGPTGSGKSSTLASLLRLASVNRPVHIVTIEDPIEFLIADSLGSVTQREVGTDTLSFSDALRNALRQDPDIIAIGEMRDPETMATAMTAAETGHLVISTLHTNSAAQTIHRIIDAFPARQHEQVRDQLSNVLQGIVSLKLVSRRDGGGLTAAVEILRSTPRIARLIAEGNITEIEVEMEKSVTFFKMQSMNQSLMALVLNGVVDLGVAQSATSKPEDFEREMRKVLYASDTEGAGGFDMADSQADFSRITELQEIKRLYDDLQGRHQSELQEREELLKQVQEQLRERDDRLKAMTDGSTRAKEEADKAKREVAFLRQDAEAKIAKLQARIKELSGTSSPEPDTSGSKRGFFSR